MNIVGVTFALLVCLVSASAQANRITSSKINVVIAPQGHFRIEQIILGASVFDVAPFQANNKTIVPGFADPLGTGIDPKLRLFSGKVHNMDVLGDYNAAAQTAEESVALPPNALRGLDIRDDLLTAILSGEERAFDQSVLQIKGSELHQLGGLPVTSESSPLSLAGFGTVSEYLKPFRLHWTLCAETNKRIRILDQVARAYRKRVKPSPTACYSI